MKVICNGVFAKCNNDIDRITRIKKLSISLNEYDKLVFVSTLHLFKNYTDGNFKLVLVN